MNNLNNKIKQIVQSNLERMGTLSINEIIEIIRPHYVFDVQKLIEAELRREARRIIRSFRDVNGNMIYRLDRNGNINNMNEM